MSQTIPEKFGNNPLRSFQTTTRSDAVKADGPWTKPAANRWHNLITTNFVVALGSRIHRGTCEIYACDMQVSVSKDSVYAPDIVVVNGEPEFADDRSEILQNPTVIIDVFSTGPRTSDRTQKLEGFLAIPKIKECLLVHEDEMRVEHYARQNAKQWIYRIYDERDDVVNMDSAGCKISLGEIYAQVKLRARELGSRATH